jgi:hypothetical protein
MPLRLKREQISRSNSATKVGSPAIPTMIIQNKWLGPLDPSIASHFSLSPVMAVPELK